MDSELLKTVDELGEETPSAADEISVDLKQIHRSLSEAQRGRLLESWRQAVRQTGSDDAVDLYHTPKPTARKLLELGMVRKKPGHEDAHLSNYRWWYGVLELTEEGVAVGRALSGKSAAEYKQEIDREAAEAAAEREREEKKRAARDKRVTQLMAQANKLGIELPHLNAQLSRKWMPESYSLPAEELLTLLELALADQGSRAGE